jgi:YVTN family beta-propeller protein
MTALAAQTMAARLTLPFARGADTATLTLTGSTATGASVAAYDFREHNALFGLAPEPRYVLLAMTDAPVRTSVTVDYVVPGPAGTVVPRTTQPLEIPEGTPAGTTFLLDLAADEGPSTVLRAIHVTSPGTVSDAWQITALLGNLSKLLWILGAERNLIREQLKRVAQQRYLSIAVRSSLDLKGSDLSVPRFPPLPYFFDQPTIQFTEALYHLDDVPATGQPEVDEVTNVMVLYPGKAALPGTNAGRMAKSMAPGRFGTAFTFRDPAAQIEVNDDPRLNVSAVDSFTWECFVKPDTLLPGPGLGIWHPLRKHADPNDATKPGWALSVGEFGRGLPINARLLLSDGTVANQLTVFADLSLTTARFNHLAAVLDRQAGEARVYVDGVLCTVKPLGALASLLNTEKFRIGNSPTAPYQGVIDEVRLSRTAFATFFPVLGESDDSYRRRLQLFERWTLPTPMNLQELLNEAAGSIGGDPAALVVNDVDTTQISGSLNVAVIPVALPPGTSIDAMGNRRVQEVDVNGIATDELTFDPVFLVTHNDPARVTYITPPARTLNAGELPPDAHKIQLVLTRPLNRLLDLLGQPGANRLVVRSAFDPRAPDLRAVGRGILLTHTSKQLDQLSALAYQAAFSFVWYRPDLGAVYASVAQGDYVGITVVAGGTAVTSDGFDLRIGETLNLQAVPALPADFTYRWLTIPCGAGRARFMSKTDGNAVSLQATAPGALHVKVEVARRQRVASATSDFQVGVIDLADGQSIDDEGNLGVDVSVAGDPDNFFNPAYLVTSDLVTSVGQRPSYGTDINHRRMQASLDRRLRSLLNLIGATGAPGSLTVVQAYTLGASGLAGQGRVLVLSHASPLARLGALAHAVGFTYVRRQGNQVEVRQAQDDLVSVLGTSSVAEGASIPVSLLPRALPAGVAVSTGKVYVANNGTDTVSEIDGTSGVVLRTFKVGWQPVAVVVSPDSKSLYTADSASNTVTQVVLATGAIQTVAVSRKPVALVVDPAHPRVFVCCQEDNTLVPIDTNTLTASPAVSIGNQPSSLAITPDGKEVWVVLAKDQKINVLATATMTSAALIALPEAPQNIVLSSSGVRAYVSFPDAGRLRVLDVAGRTILGQLAAGVMPTALAVTPDDSTLLVLDPGKPPHPVEQVHVLSTLAASPFVSAQGTVQVRRQPAGVVADATHAYVTNGGTDDLSVIDFKPGEIGGIATWRLGSGLGERLTWVVRATTKDKAVLSGTTDPTVTLTGMTAGPIQVRAVNLLLDGADPYTFEVRLKPALEQDPNILIRKDQYDVIMNVLNAFHPAGVEVISRAIRERVIEVRTGLLNAFPAYTHPNFRVPGPSFRRPQQQ